MIVSSKRGGPTKNLHYYWDCISRRASLEGVRIHDLGIPMQAMTCWSVRAIPMIGRLLSQTNVPVLACYVHFANNYIKSANNRIEDKIVKIVG